MSLRNVRRTNTAKNCVKALMHHSLMCIEDQLAGIQTDRRRIREAEDVQNRKYMDHPYFPFGRHSTISSPVAGDLIMPIRKPMGVDVCMTIRMPDVP